MSYDNEDCEHSDCDVTTWVVIMRAAMQTMMTVVMGTTLGRRQRTMKTIMSRMALKKQKMMQTMTIITNSSIIIIIVISTVDDINPALP